jgi:RNA polymerase sigma-70 factor (ECF subfamily)
MDIMISSRSAEARKHDDQDAVGLINEFHVRIYAFLRRLTGNNSDAEDLTQRTFTRVWQALEKFEGRSSIASWIHGIAYHVYVDWRRAQRPGEFQTDEWWASCPSSTPTPAELVESSDLAHAVYEAVDHLDSDLRNAVHLRYYQALTVQETADALGVAVSTIKYRLNQALDELQAVLVRQPALAKHLQTP